MTYTSEQIQKHGDLILLWENSEPKPVIECASSLNGGWMRCTQPFFDINAYYRVKPEPTVEYVPFAFEDNELFRDKWLVHKEFKSLRKIIAITDKNLTIGDRFYSYNEAFDLLEFENGTPFGKKL